MNIILAPLRGFTDSTFRNLHSSFFEGVDSAVAPFITSVKGSKIKLSHIRDLIPENNYKLPVTPQILSKDGNEFITLAKVLFDLGYSEVNWNLGCPYSMVANKMRGSGLLPFPEIIDMLLEKIISSIPGSLSIKTRLGRWNSEEITKLIPVFNNYPLSSITIHPRTGIQMYTGSVDLNSFEDCLRTLKHPIIYNGDIKNFSDFLKLKNLFPSISGWMIGRGILINPFIAEIIKNEGINSNFIITRFLEFHKVMLETYKRKFFGYRHVLDRMKGLWNYFALGFKDGKKVIKKIRKTITLEHYEKIVDMFLQEKL